MQWKAYFLPETLKHGYTYFEKNAVKGFTSTKDSCMARVLGTKIYQVSIRGLSTGRLSMYCNCSDAQSGMNCKHMAAVLYEWAHTHHEDDEPAAEVDHFRDHPLKEDLFFNVRRMTSDFIISPELERRASAMIEKGQIALKDVSIRYGRSGDPDGATGQLTAEYQAQRITTPRGETVGDPRRIQITFSRTRFLNMTCDACRRRVFYSWSHEMCTHEMAAVYLLADYLNKYNPGDATDEAGEKFLLTYARKRTDSDEDAGTRRRQIRLVPRVVSSEKGWSLTFRVGVNRMYVIRNLTDFVRTVQEEGSMPVGKHDALHFHVETFTDAGAKYYQFVKEQVEQARRLDKRIHQPGTYYGPDLVLHSDIPLEGETVDRLYDLLEETGSAEYIDRSGREKTATLSVTKHLPRIHLTLLPIIDLNRIPLQDLKRLDHMLDEIPPEQLEGISPAVNSGDSEENPFAFHLGRQIDAVNDPGEAVETSKEEVIDSMRRRFPVGAVQMYAARLVKATPENCLGVRLTGGMPHIVHGAKGGYAITPGKIARYPAEKYREIAPLLDAAQDGFLSIYFGTKHLAEFFYRVLPMLEDNSHIVIDEPQDLENSGILPPQALFDFKMDIDDGRILCYPSVSYEGQEHDLVPMDDLGGPLEPYRDRTQEERVLEEISGRFPDFDPRTGAFTAQRTDDAVFDLLDDGVGRMQRLGTVEGSEAFDRLTIRPIPKVRIGVSVQADLMNLDILSSELSSDELLELLGSYRRRKRYHRLKSGEYIRLGEDDSMQMLSRVMDDLGVNISEFTDGKMHLPLYRALYINKMLETHDEIAADRDRRFRTLVKNFKTVEDSDYDVPPSLDGVLRGYQVYGYKWFRTLAASGFGGILADDMGLGKTLETIALLLAVREEEEDSAAPGNDHQPSLIVCPASLVYNWQEEFRRFAPRMSVCTVTGTAAERRKILEGNRDVDVLITSYDLLKRDIGQYENLTFSCQVLDEAQYIKNPAAAVSKAVKIIHSAHRFALTGTPIENRLSELWSIFDYLMPGFLYSYDQFRTQFESPITQDGDDEAARRLRRMTGPFILRRLKSDVLKDLPQKLEEVRYARMEDDQRALYDAQVTHMKQVLAESKDNPGKMRMRVLAELTKIREICCDPSLIVERYQGGSAKRRACLDLVRSAIDGGHKMLIFSQFTSMLELLGADLAREKIPYYVITGATKKEERIRLVHAFNDDETPVFLISLKAGGTGLNLTGADVVIHYDPWWNLAAQNQATDRAHRIGQTKEVSVFRLITKDTIEERIVKMQEKKRDLADAILSGESQSLAQLTPEELMELLG